MKRTQKKSLADAVEFLRRHGGDPARWAPVEADSLPRKADKQHQAIAALAAETRRQLERSRERAPAGPPKP